MHLIRLQATTEQLSHTPIHTHTHTLLEKGINTEVLQEGNKEEDIGEGRSDDM